MSMTKMHLKVILIWPLAVVNNMKKSKQIYIFSGIVILGLTLIIAFFLSDTQNRNKEKIKIENCSQYNSIPEKYSDRIPTDCLGPYFEQRQKEKDIEQINYRKSIEEARKN